MDETVCPNWGVVMPFPYVDLRRYKYCSPNNPHTCGEEREFVSLKEVIQEYLDNLLNPDYPAK